MKNIIYLAARNNGSLPKTCIMRTLNTLPPRLLKCYIFKNVFKTAGFRYNLLLIILLFFTQLGLNAQSMFEIDNQTPCDWPLVIYCTQYTLCKPIIQPPITINASQNTITTINLSTYYPWVNARVIKVEVYHFRYQSWETIGESSCGYVAQTPTIYCPYNSGYIAHYYGTYMNIK